METRRFIYKCQICKAIWAIDYEVIHKESMVFLPYKHPVYKTEYHLNGIKVDPERARCITREQTNYKQHDTSQVRADRVDGVKNDSVRCDARCQNAHGHDCECSCGGANHGNTFLSN